MKSDTPRTDAAIECFQYDTVMLGGEIGGDSRDIIDPDFARELEREANALLKVVNLFAYNEGTLFQREWRSYGISEEEEAIIEAAIARSIAEAALAKAK